MKKSYSKQEKERIITQYESGVSITSIYNSTGIARSTLHNWINEYNSKKDTKPLNRGDYNKLKMHCEKLENMIQILKICGCTVDAPLSQRYEVIKELSSVYSITALCNALNVPKGSYYNHILRNKNDDTLAARRIKELTPVVEKIYNESNQIYGPGKVAAVMNDRGYSVGLATVSKIMHENGWFSIRGGAKALYEMNQKRKENILKQQFTVSRPNEVWVSDITYYTYNQIRYYICVVIDLFARKVVSWKISKKNSTQLTKKTFMQAYSSREITGDLLFHSDQGSNFVSKTFMNYLKELDVKQSFSKPGRPYDNSVCESFFSNFKQEE